MAEVLESLPVTFPEKDDKKAKRLIKEIEIRTMSSGATLR